MHEVIESMYNKSESKSLLFFSEMWFPSIWTFICPSASIKHVWPSFSQQFIICICGFITETVRTVLGKPCVNDWKIPFRGNCLKLPYKQPLEVRSLRGKRKYKICTKLLYVLEKYEKKIKPKQMQSILKTCLNKV